MAERPEVLNHNTETVLRLQRDVRTSANYGRSLALLSRAKRSTRWSDQVRSDRRYGRDPRRGAGDLADMRAVGIDIVTIGQYLRPTPRHRPIHRYVHPAEFDEYRHFGESIGIPHVESGPLVRSSYHAKDASRRGRSLGERAPAPRFWPVPDFDYAARIRSAQSLMADSRSMRCCCRSGPISLFHGLSGHAARAADDAGRRSGIGTVPGGSPTGGAEGRTRAFETRPWGEPRIRWESLGTSAKALSRLRSATRPGPFSCWVSSSAAGDVPSATPHDQDSASQQGPREIDYLRRAGAGADRVSARLKGLEFSGRTEREILAT